MRNKAKIIIVYTLYLTIFLGLIYLLLPATTKQTVLETLNVHENQTSAISDVTSDVKVSRDTSGKFIVITFDDSFSSQYGAYKQLEKYGYKGTLYINSGLIGKEDRLTIKQLKEMYNAGWDISNHTENHADLTKVSEKKAYDEIYGCSAWLKEYGFTRKNGHKHFAYPYGAYNDDVVQILEKQGFLTARTTNAGSATEDLLLLGRASLSGMTKENIHDFMFSDEKLIILNLHRIVPDDSKDIGEIDLKQSYFDTLVQAIKDSNREVITLTEWYDLRDAIK